MSSVNVLSLSAGQDGLSVPVPDDGGKRHPAPFALQSHHRVQQSRGFGGYVATFDGGGNWRNGIRILIFKNCILALFGHVYYLESAI